MISIIGLGGAGGNIADESKELGFTTGAINFSQEDLGSINVQFKLRLPGADGVGRNQNLAANLFNDHYQIAINYVKQNFLHSDVILVPFSTSGGSGGGIAPVFLDLMSNIFPEKIFVGFPILPDLSEVTVSQLNTLDTFDKLLDLNIALFPIDNQQVKNKYDEINKNKLYRKVNNSTINLLNKIISYTDKYSKISNFDKRDLYALLGTKGIGTISEINLNEFNGLLSNGMLFNKIYSSWEKSVFTPIEYQKVTRAGFILDGDEKYLNHLRYSYIFSKFDSGVPIGMYEGIYNEGNNKIYTILSGLSWCETRLKEIDDLIDKDKTRIQDVISSTNEKSQYKARSLGLSEKLKNPNFSTKSIDDILNRHKKSTSITINTNKKASEVISKYRR